MAVHLLEPASLAGAVRQLVTCKDFRAKNQHLSMREYRALLSSPPVWPESPVFSPYAATHGEYSQSKHPLKLQSIQRTNQQYWVVRIGGTKYLVHRVTYAAYNGGIIAGEDVSHIMYIGARTARYVHIT